MVRLQFCVFDIYKKKVTDEGRYLFMPYSGVFEGNTEKEAKEKAEKWYNKKGYIIEKRLNRELILTEPAIDPSFGNYDLKILNEKK